MLASTKWVARHLFPFRRVKYFLEIDSEKAAEPNYVVANMPLNDYLNIVCFC
jgi:hypothetical protein